MARQMVTRFGMSDLGPMSLETGNQEVFLGRALTTRSDVSDSIANKIDLSVRQMVQSSYADTVQLVSSIGSVMDRLGGVIDLEGNSGRPTNFRAIVWNSPQFLRGIVFRRVIGR